MELPADFLSLGRGFVINTLIHKLYLINNQIFLIYKSFVVQFIYQLHLHNTLKWVPNEDLGFI